MGIEADDAGLVNGKITPAKAAGGLCSFNRPIMYAGWNGV